MDQTSCNAEQIEVVEDLSQALKIIFYPLPLYYHLFKEKKSSEILMEKKKAEQVLFLPSVPWCCSVQSCISVLCSFPTLEQPER